jgi:hypothetical protein
LGDLGCRGVAKTLPQRTIGSRFLDPREHVFSGHLADEIGVVLSHVCLDLRDYLVVGRPPCDVAALTPDQLRHLSSSIVAQ